MSAEALTYRPDNFPILQAAGAASTFLTAYQVIVDICRVEEGQTVFINGGSTSVGSMAIQIAKARGARVVATASGKNESHVRSLGADEVREPSVS